MKPTDQEMNDAIFDFMHRLEDTRAKVSVNDRKFLIFNRCIDDRTPEDIKNPADYCQIELREFKEFRNDWGDGSINDESEKVWSFYSQKLLENWFGDREKVFKEEFFSNFKK